MQLIKCISDTFHTHHRIYFTIYKGCPKENELTNII